MALTNPNVSGVVSALAANYAVSFAPTAVSTDANVSLTAASVAGGGVVRSGTSDGWVDTLPTAAAIFTAVTNAVAGQTFRFTYANVTGFAITLTSNTGITFANTSGGSTDTVSAGNSVVYQVTLVSATAVTWTRQWSNAAGS